MLGQMFDDPKALMITAGLLLIMGIVPGMPHLAFLSLGGLAAGGAYWQLTRAKSQPSTELQEQEGGAGAAGEQVEVKELGWDDVRSVDTIGLEVGYRLIPRLIKAKVVSCWIVLRGFVKSYRRRWGFWFHLCILEIT